jgi:SAM-dependent methyltransferase
MDFASVERNEWTNSAVAANYAEGFARAAEMCVPAFVDRCGGAAEVLDLCCGHGIIARALVDAGMKATAADFSPAMLELAAARVPEARIIEADAMALLFDDETFDAITIGFGIPHVPDPPQVLRECWRVLRPGGRLVYSAWRGPEAKTAMVGVFQAIAAYGDPTVQLPPGPGASDYVQPTIAGPALEAAGFEDVVYDTVPSKWVSDDPAAPYDYFLNGTARGGFLLRQQGPEFARSIRAAIVAWVEKNCPGGPPWQIPIPAGLVTATKA